MPNVSLRRKVVLCFLLATVLTAPWASAAGRTAPAPDLFHQILSFVASLWGDTGCHIDPSGRCATLPKTDEGCHIDPFGRCATLPKTNEGCNVDPFGRCGAS
jgi:hypothetical protein